MPATLTYPGVYIEEIPSGVRPISGVATSIAAFIGWAPKGNISAATRVLSWSDFERKLGGIDSRSLLGTSVYQFFVNGGQDAYIVRLADAGATAGAVTAGTLDFKARNPGDWSSTYGIVVKAQTGDPTRFRVAVVSVVNNIETEVEGFENLSMTETDRRNAVKVINARSSIVMVQSNGPGVPGDTALPSPLLAGGAPGSVLVPDAGNFETALDAALPQLERVDLFNLLCVPGETNAAKVATLQGFCKDHRAFYIVDCPQDAVLDTADDDLGTIGGDAATNAALYFPWINAPDPAAGRPAECFSTVRIRGRNLCPDRCKRGVWKAPAGTEASLTGVNGVTVPLTDKENGVLNIQGVNCIRNFPVYGTVVWGARTLQGNDERGSEWKYVPVRRTALFIEESLYRGTAVGRVRAE